jgi:hypothetical protein
MILYFSMLSQHSVHCCNSRIFHSINDLFFRCDLSAVWCACLSAYIVNIIRDTSSRLSNLKMKILTFHFVHICHGGVYIPVEILSSTQYTVYSIQHTVYSIQYTAHSIQYTLNMVTGGKRICNLTATAIHGSLPVDPSGGGLCDVF